MKILSIDIGTGTQDIFLYDSELDIENGFKMVVPSPTMMVAHQIKAATARRDSILLTGSTMGGGPSTWAAEAHARVGLPIYATPSAARTFNDELDKVERMGIQVVSEDETRSLLPGVVHLELKDFDFALIAESFARFQVSLANLEAICVGVFDHGNAPPGVSDRQFRFDYLDQRIRAKNALSAFAYVPENIPAIMTRLLAVAKSASALPCPMVVMDTAPAAILGASFDPLCATRKRKLIVNVGNFHTIAFRLGTSGIEGVFEHHTGELNRNKLEHYLRSMADGSLRHTDVFNDMGHGALIYEAESMPLGQGEWDLIVSGPRRSMFGTAPAPIQNLGRQPIPALRPRFATPFGDMMLAGNFGLLAAAADLLPSSVAIALRDGLSGRISKHQAPWDISG
jgi:uncharacterized protein (DUF1786 family)